jgi:hypothetical protein
MDTLWRRYGAPAIMIPALLRQCACRHRPMVRTCSKATTILVAVTADHAVPVVSLSLLHVIRRLEAVRLDSFAFPAQ